jgi:hypothetical protein
MHPHHGTHARPHQRVAAGSIIIASRKDESDRPPLAQRRRGNMAAFTYDESDTDPSPPRNVLLRVLDTLAEWLMQQELRVISRSRVVAPVRANNKNNKERPH